MSSAALIRVSASSSAHLARQGKVHEVLESAIIAARQGFADVNKGTVAATGTATCASALIDVTLSSSPVRFACEAADQVKERVGLADKQPVGREGFYSRHRTAFLYRGRPND